MTWSIARARSVWPAFPPDGIALRVAISNRGRTVQRVAFASSRTARSFASGEQARRAFPTRVPAPVREICALAAAPPRHAALVKSARARSALSAFSAPSPQLLRGASKTAFLLSCSSLRRVRFDFRFHRTRSSDYVALTLISSPSELTLSGAISLLESATLYRHDDLESCSCPHVGWSELVLGLFRWELRKQQDGTPVAGQRQRRRVRLEPARAAFTRRCDRRDGLAGYACVRRRQAHRRRSLRRREPE